MLEGVIAAWGVSFVGVPLTWTAIGDVGESWDSLYFDFLVGESGEMFDEYLSYLLILHYFYNSKSTDKRDESLWDIFYKIISGYWYVIKRQWILLNHCCRREADRSSQL